MRPDLPRTQTAQDKSVPPHIRDRKWVAGDIREGCSARPPRTPGRKSARPCTRRTCTSVPPRIPPRRPEATRDIRHGSRRCRPRIRGHTGAGVQDHQVGGDQGQVDVGL